MCEQGFLCKFNNVSGEISVGCNTLQVNIFKDPLTGLSNFFKFIECNAEGTFGKNGIVIIIDMVNFVNVNKNYGRGIGDLCLTKLAQCIKNNIERYQNSCAFRTDGDEFTLVLQELAYDEGQELVDSIKEDFNKNMAKEGYLDFQFHSLLLSYDETISSIEQFYEIVLKKSINYKNNCKDKFTQDRILRHLVGTFTRRIRDTLSFFDNACSLALTDDISGLPNHRAGRLYLNELMENSLKENVEFSVLFIDGDNLKRYNQISYQRGNEMIRNLSTIIKSSLRCDDKIYRWLSGDEFIVVIKENKDENVLKLAERVRVAVEASTEHWEYPITVSIGVSKYPNDGETIEEIIDKAEKANGTAKAMGKNTVVIWEKV